MSINLREIKQRGQALSQGRYSLGRDSAGAEIRVSPDPLAGDVLALVQLVRAFQDALFTRGPKDDPRCRGCGTSRGRPHVQGCWASPVLAQVQDED